MIDSRCRSRVPKMRQVRACPHRRNSRLELQTSNSSRRPYSHINNCFLWQLVSSLHFERAIDCADDRVAVL